MNFTFFSSAHGTFSRIDHILGHKASIGKFKKIEIIPSIFSDHNAVRLDLNYTPSPGPGAAGGGGKLRSIIHYLRALIGLRRGRGHGGDQGTRARDAEGRPCRREEGVFA